jgi:hypothetical protein
MNKIEYCQAWSGNKNSRCSNRAMRGTNYCWWHYPKKALIVEFLIVFILTLTLSDPCIHFLSKIPIFYYLDKNKPLIEEIVPPIDKSSLVDKTTKYFEIFCRDNDSGLNLDKSYLKVSRKENQTYTPISGKLDKRNFSIRFSPEKELQYGEYLFEAMLVDRANNKSEFKTPFVVREKDELIALVGYDTYENASDPDRKIFSSFIEDNKESLKYSKLYICKLYIGNKDNIANLKDVYLHIEMPDEIRCWEQVGNFNATKAEIYGTAAESFNKTFKGRIYANWNYLKLEKIGPSGATIFLILASRTTMPIESEEIILERERRLENMGVDIYGTCLSEGYGSSESRKVRLNISRKDFKSLRDF